MSLCCNGYLNPLPTLYNSLFCLLSNNYFDFTKPNLSAFVAQVDLVKYIMSKLTLDFINWVHLKCFNVFSLSFYQFHGFPDVIINGHLKGEKCYILKSRRHQ